MTTTVAPDPADTVAAFLASPKQMLIGSEWVDAADSATFDAENPATGAVLAAVPAGAAADVDRAVRAARESFDAKSWRGMAPAQRAAVLWQVGDCIAAHLEELIHLEVLDNGMPRAFAELTINGAVESFRYFSGMCTRIGGDTGNVGPDLAFHAYSSKVPVGVAGLIVPWNGPIATACNKIAPALAAGCSVVLKPAEQTPLSALRIGQLALEAGLPAGVLNIVTGTGEQAGRALVNHDGVDKISFTGSTAVGKSIVQAAAGNLKRISLELGGKSPVFVFDDADLEVTVPAVAMGIFGNSGQVCFAGSRLYAQAGIYDELIAGVKTFAEKLTLGSGLDRATMLGPLISDVQLKRVMDYIDGGVDAGAELVTGGKKHGDEGYFVEPTIFAGVDPAMAIVQEEIFGPVLTVNRFNGIDDVARLGNATTYGLGAGVYTTNVSTAHKAAAMLDAGNVWVNCYGMTDKSMPFGGFKQSGWGRENGADGVDMFLEKKAVYIKL